MKRDSDAPMLDAAKKKRADTIRLNIGGCRFETTPQTLSALPFFEPLIEDRIPFAVDERGCAFVDRLPGGGRRFIYRVPHLAHWMELLCICRVPPCAATFAV